MWRVDESSEEEASDPGEAEEEKYTLEWEAEADDQLLDWVLDFTRRLEAEQPACPDSGAEVSATRFLDRRCGDWLCPAIITFPIGLAIAVTTYGQRWDAKRFRDAGVISTAEIVAVRIRQGGENPDVAELRVRISGPGFDTTEVRQGSGVDVSKPW
jgi:hypothetical protein